MTWPYVKDLAYRVNVGEPTISKIFHKWMDLMYKELIIWPELSLYMKTCLDVFQEVFHQ